MDTFDALADPVRRDLILAVAAAPASAGQLAARHPTISRPAVSRHLRVLVEAGVLVADADGRHRIFQLAPAALAEVDVFLAAVRATPAARVVDAFDALDTEVARTRRERRRTTPTERRAPGAGPSDDPTGPPAGGSAEERTA